MANELPLPTITAGASHSPRSIRSTHICCSAAPSIAVGSSVRSTVESCSRYASAIHARIVSSRSDSLPTIGWWLGPNWRRALGLPIALASRLLPLLRDELVVLERAEADALEREAQPVGGEQARLEDLGDGALAEQPLLRVEQVPRGEDPVMSSLSERPRSKGWPISWRRK